MDAGGDDWGWDAVGDTALDVDDDAGVSLALVCLWVRISLAPPRQGWGQPAPYSFFFSSALER